MTITNKYAIVKFDSLKNMYYHINKSAVMVDFMRLFGDRPWMGQTGQRPVIRQGKGSGPVNRGFYPVG